MFRFNDEPFFHKGQVPNIPSNLAADHVGTVKNKFVHTTKLVRDDGFKQRVKVCDI